MNAPNPATPPGLPQHVIDEAALREEELFAERAELLTRGKLMPHLEKKYQKNQIWALNIFADTAVKVSEIEAATEPHGQYAHATWKLKHTNEPTGGEAIALMFLGPLGLLIGLFGQRKRTAEIEYTTIHRLPNDQVKFWQLKRGGYVTGKVVGLLAGIAGIIWTIVQIAIAADKHAAKTEQFMILLPLAVTLAGFWFMWWCDRRTLPRMLRIYSGKKFQLKSLRFLEPQRPSDVR